MSKKEKAQSPEEQAEQEVQTATAEVNEVPKVDFAENTDALSKENEELKAKVAMLEEAQKADKEQLLRTLAEYDNYRKRTDREKAATYDSARAATIEEFLSAADNLELALAQKDCTAESLRKGVEMIDKNVKDILSRLGVAVLGIEGETFNPEYHQAVSHVEDPSHGENEVITVYRKGYRIGDKIIRHATVIVAN